VTVRAPASTPPLLDIHHVTKRFPGVVANDRVNLTVQHGEVHALLGENGAGKTTLMHMLYGLQAPDAGTMSVQGQPVRFRSPNDARAAGIGLVAQHFHLAGRHTVAENLALAQSPFWRPTRHLHTRIKEIEATYGFELDLAARVNQLSPGQQQRIEIVKALLQGAQLLILDEPTSVLTPQEAEQLFRVIDTMRQDGKGIIFISHKLGEVMRIADRVTVLRGGAVAGSRNVSDTNTGELARLMVGRSIDTGRQTRTQAAGEVRLSVRDLQAARPDGEPALRGVTFDIHAGEILGVAGVAGNGQAELTQVLTGLAEPTSGNVTLDGRDASGLTVRELFDRGVVHIPEDRNHMGVVGAMRISENLVMRRHRNRPFNRRGRLDWKAVDRHADDAIRDYDIAAPSKHAVTRQLSGGNVQKVILARELSGQPGLVVASHPSYGLDVAATELTHDLLRRQRDEGAAVLLVSEDLDELLKLADRILVLYQGEAVGVVEAEASDRETLGLMMAGRTPDPAQAELA
jgi:simple sugar transport system ATP-binding protein